MLAGAVITGLVLANLFSVDTRGPSPSATRSPPVRGIACPDLQQAAAELEAGNDSEFVRVVDAAVRTGLAALQRSGEIFGRPEKLAVDLASIVQAGAPARARGLDRIMSQIRAACSKLDRWQ